MLSLKVIAGLAVALSLAVGAAYLYKLKATVAVQKVELVKKELNKAEDANKSQERTNKVLKGAIKDEQVVAKKQAESSSKRNKEHNEVKEASDNAPDAHDTISPYDDDVNERLRALDKRAGGS